MRVQVKFSIDRTNDTIDLEDLGFEEDTKWSDLTEDEQNEILDSLREEIVIYCSVEEE